MMMLHTTHNIWDNNKKSKISVKQQPVIGLTQFESYTMFFHPLAEIEIKMISNVVVVSTNFKSDSLLIRRIFISFNWIEPVASEPKVKQNTRHYTHRSSAQSSRIVKWKKKVLRRFHVVVVVSMVDTHFFLFRSKLSASNINEETRVVRDVKSESVSRLDFKSESCFIDGKNEK